MDLHYPHSMMQDNLEKCVPLRICIGSQRHTNKHTHTHAHIHIHTHTWPVLHTKHTHTHTHTHKCPNTQIANNITLELTHAPSQVARSIH